MAPIKFEEQLKEKLEKRSLQPSADAWTKLSERLDDDNKRTKTPWITWLSIAAGVIILLSVLVQTFGSKSDQEVVPQMVNEDTIEQMETKEQLPATNNNEAIDLVAEDDSENVVNETPSKSEVTKELINSGALKKSQPKEQLAEQATPEVPSEKKDDSMKDLQKTLINEMQINKDAVAKALNELPKDRAAATDREVDSLLKLASKELVKDNLLKDASKTVDAQSLLEDVEDEMGQSFRSKVYEVLKDGYKTVKTAVVQRNN